MAIRVKRFREIPPARPSVLGRPSLESGLRSASRKKLRPGYFHAGIIFTVCAGLFIFAVLALKAFNMAGPVDTGQALAAAQMPSEVLDAAKNEKPVRKHLVRAVYESHDNLLDVGYRDAVSLFGESEFVRTDFPTVIWQYRTENCVLDLYFKARNGNSLGRIAHYEMRSRAKNGTVETKTCMGELLQRNEGPQMVSVSSFYKSRLQ